MMSEPAGYPVFAEFLPQPLATKGKFEVRFARSPEELEAVQRLRFEVFNVEMGEGLEESFATGLDRDRFDPVCHHLLVLDRTEDRVVGTYRMQTATMASRFLGFYSADEFVLDDLPRSVVENAIEVGRASVAKRYRNRQVLFLLWQGLAAYMQSTGKRFLFGCCSLTSQDPAEGKRVMDHLSKQGLVHPEYHVRTQPGWECYAEDFELPDDVPSHEVELPRLFQTYLRYGALVCGPPAIDRAFKTIDYLVLLDVERLDEHTRRMYFR